MVAPPCEKPRIVFILPEFKEIIILHFESRFPIKTSEVRVLI